MVDKKFFDAVATLTGTVIGAGVFGIPYAVAQAGFLTGIAAIVLIGLVVLMVNLCLGEVCLRTEGVHQLTDYAKFYLGEWGQWLMSASLIFGIYASLTAYILGEGEALYSIFGVLSPEFFSFLFLVVMSVIVLFGLEAVEEAELVMVSVIILLIVVISGFSFGHLSVSNLSTGVEFSKLLLPYGVILFAFGGFAAVPELKAELMDRKEEMKKSIVTGMLVPMVLYVVFTTVVVGVTGVQTTEVATIGLGEVVGDSMLVVSNLFVVFAMATSFLTLTLALEQVYSCDYGLDGLFSWMLAVFVPLLIAFSGFTSFIEALGLAGSVGFGVTSVLIILMFWRAKEKGGRSPEFSVSLSRGFGYLLILVFVGGVVYQLLGLF